MRAKESRQIRDFLYIPFEVGMGGWGNGGSDLHAVRNYYK